MKSVLAISFLFLFSFQSKALHVVSDYDDTLRQANVRNPVDAAWRFASGQDAFWPGIKELFLKLKDAEAFRLSIVSGSPEFARDRILNRSKEVLGFFPNDLFLKSSFEDTVEYKIDKISKLVSSSQDSEFLFLGDNNEKDQEIYLELKKVMPKLAKARMYIHKVMDRPELLGLNYYLTPFELAYTESLEARSPIQAEEVIDLAGQLLEIDGGELLPDFAHCPKARRDWFFDCSKSSYAQLNAACEQIQAHYFEICAKR